MTSKEFTRKSVCEERENNRSVLSQICIEFKFDWPLGISQATLVVGMLGYRLSRNAMLMRISRGGLPTPARDKNNHFVFPSELILTICDVLELGKCWLAGSRHSRKMTPSRLKDSQREIEEDAKFLENLLRLDDVQVFDAILNAETYQLRKMAIGHSIQRMNSRQKEFDQAVELLKLQDQEIERLKTQLVELEKQLD